tara:strand:+ start:2619 stop:3059 length:441 start_codon:yes stop_codon:yes gene_type:complete
MKIKLKNLKSLKLLIFPIFLSSFIFDATLLKKEIYANQELSPANENDLYLYKGMGASYLCIASKAGIEFPKAVGVATATYVQVLEGKHGGLIEELGDTKLEREKLFAGAEFQIVNTAMKYCPDSVPKDVTKKINKILKDTSKKSKK